MITKCLEDGFGLGDSILLIEVILDEASDGIGDEAADRLFIAVGDRFRSLSINTTVGEDDDLLEDVITCRASASSSSPS